MPVSKLAPSELGTMGTVVIRSDNTLMKESLAAVNRTPEEGDGDFTISNIPN